jgi:hypothetical protein
LAAATAQREAAVRLGLRWLAARGHVHIVQEDGDIIRLGPGDGIPRGEAAALMVHLQRLLEESAAYRRYFQQAEPDALIS